MSSCLRTYVNQSAAAPLTASPSPTELRDTTLQIAEVVHNRYNSGAANQAGPPVPLNPLTFSCSITFPTSDEERFRAPLKRLSKIFTRATRCEWKSHSEAQMVAITIIEIARDTIIVITVGTYSGDKFSQKSSFHCEMIVSCSLFARQHDLQKWRRKEGRGK